jgi:L-ribulose-5-phosphate 3-epimerase
MKIAVCDWMILKRQKLGAFGLAQELGADGVEVDMGPLGDRPTFENALAQPDVRERFLAEAKARKLEICSLAMSGFYAQSFAERPGVVEKMVPDCLATMTALGVKVAFLPLGTSCDLVAHPELRPVVIERLRAVGKLAAQAGVVIGIETELDAAGEKKLLDEIGSKAIRSYFNFSNPLKKGRDLHKELKILGRERICQIHATDDDGYLLSENPRLDLRAVKKTLAEMRWDGWLVIERSRSARDPRNVKANFGANVKYLKSIFVPPLGGG